MGFEDSRFDVKVDEDFRCPICQDIIEDPIGSQCEHIFCKTCINQWLQTQSSCPLDRKLLTIPQLCEPSRFFRNFYRKLIIKCEFESNGCRDKFMIEEMNSHQNKCKFNPIVKRECDKGCEAILTNSEFQKHNCIQYLKEKLNDANKLLSKKEKTFDQSQIRSVNSVIIQSNQELIWPSTSQNDNNRKINSNFAQVISEFERKIRVNQIPIKDRDLEQRVKSSVSNNSASEREIMGAESSTEYSFMGRSGIRNSFGDFRFDSDDSDDDYDDGSYVDYNDDEDNDDVYDEIETIGICIRNKKSGLVLDMSKSIVSLQVYNGKSCQLWNIEGKFIISKQNGNTLDIASEHYVGLPIITYPHHGGMNQQWHVNLNGTITGGRDNLALSVKGNILPNATLCAKPQLEGDAQKFEIVNMKK